MIVDKQVFENMINSPIRTFKGRVEILQGSTLALICGCHDRLKSFTVERIGEDGKFFGYGICQKLNVKLLDKNRELNITKANSLEVEFGVDNDYIYPCPVFHVQEVSRDENNNDLDIVAYDALYKAREHTVTELTLPAAYSIYTFAAACASILEVPLSIGEDVAESFNLFFENGAPFEGTETIRSALDAIAEATQTIYYINHRWELTFKRLDKDGAPVAVIDKTKYMTLKSEPAVQLGEVVRTNELGNTVNPTAPGEGVIQYVRNNPFWELRNDIGELVENAQAAIGGVSAHPFDCIWRGNFLLEIGDKIGLVTKDDTDITSYLLNDTMEFNGALSGKTKWIYRDNGADTGKNPTSLGEALTQTFARVDKANKDITLMTSRVDSHDTAIATIQMDVNSVNLSVENVKKDTDDKINSIGDDIDYLKESASLAVDAEAVTIAIQSEMAKGVDKVVTTEKKFTFDDAGLNIASSGSEMKTQITEDGMTVYKDREAMLMANNEGVNALNLHATTYLIIGNTSRLESWNGRTACFWIGG